jgi:transposase
VRDVSLWNAVLGVEKTVFEALEYDQEQDLLVARLRPTRRARGRCGPGRRPCPGYDGGDGRRRWRGVGPGHTYVFADTVADYRHDHGGTTAKPCS